MPLTFSLILKEVQWVYLKFYTIEIIFERSRNVFKQLVNWHKMVLQPQRTHQCVMCKIRLKDSSTNCQMREDEVQPLLVDLGSWIIPILDLRSQIILPTPRSQAHVQAGSRREYKNFKKYIFNIFEYIFKYFCTNPICFLAKSAFKHVM